MEQNDWLLQVRSVMRNNNLQKASRICRKAIAHHETKGEPLELSEAYHLLGEIEYSLGNLSSASQSFKKALSNDESSGKDDSLAYARTCNNLAATEKERGNFAEAESYLWKSIGIKETQHDEEGVAASYHQLGVVAEARRDFPNAEVWYARSLAIEQDQGNRLGAIKTLLALSSVASQGGKGKKSHEYQQQVIEILDGDLEPSQLREIASEIAFTGNFSLAKEVLEKALRSANRTDDIEELSTIHLELGRVNCQLGDFEASRIFYTRVLEDTEIAVASERIGIAYRNLGRIHLAGGSGLERSHSEAYRCFKNSLILSGKESRLELISLYISLWIRRLQLAVPRNSKRWEIFQE